MSSGKKKRGGHEERQRRGLEQRRADHAPAPDGAAVEDGGHAASRQQGQHEDRHASDRRRIGCQRAEVEAQPARDEEDRLQVT